MNPLAIVKALTTRLDEAQPGLRRLGDYYEGRHRLAFASEKFRAAFGGLFGAMSDNWCPIVVDAVEERLGVQGFRFDSDDADADAWRIWQRNALDADAGLAHGDALTYGGAAALVWAGDDGAPRITVESPLQVVVAHAPGDRRRRTSALKRWIDDDEFAYATLYLPDVILRYRSDRKMAGAADLAAPVDWRPRGEEIDNPLGVVPVVPLVNRPRTLGDGESEIAGVIPLQDAANKLLSDLLVASEFGAFKQRWATGLEIPTDPETGAPIEPFNGAVSRLWVAESETTKFGEFTATDLRNYVVAIDLIVSHIASQTRTPPHYLNPSADRLSGESIKAAETGLVAKVKRKQRHFGEAWEEVLRLAFAVTGDPRAAATSAETIWADPESRTESEHVDAVAKRQAIGVPWPQLMEDLGYSPQQIERMRAQLRLDALDAITLGDLPALGELASPTIPELGGAHGRS